MTGYIVDGPYGTLQIGADPQVPWYIITFDAEGQCTSPRARAALLEAVHSGSYDHVILFAHGWNNVWSEVEGLNRDLIGALDSVWEREDWPSGPRLLVASVFWPSVAALAEEERGPEIAAGDDDRLALEACAEALPPAQAVRLRELATHAMLDATEAAEFAALLAPLLGGDDEVAAPPPTAEQVLALARLSEGPGAHDGETIVDPTGDVWADVGAGPEAAGTLDPLSWRFPLRVASVYAMKRRAGRVGALGVAPLLRELLGPEVGAALHIGGHSYGCRVMLSALCAEPLERKAASLLLLQPAVSRFCFAERVPTTGRRGGYWAALERVRQPIMLTFSERDAALHKLFSLAMALARDIGEPDIAGPFDSIYAALGGYGPAGVEFDEPPIKAPGDRYKLKGGRRILALDGAARLGDSSRPVIASHGDVTSRYTGWMLYSQLREAAEVPR